MNVNEVHVYVHDWYRCNEEMLADADIIHPDADLVAVSAMTLDAS